MVRFIFSVYHAVDVYTVNFIFEVISVSFQFNFPPYIIFTLFYLSRSGFNIFINWYKFTLPMIMYISDCATGGT